MNRRTQEIYWWFRDRIFPWLQPLTQEEVQTQANREIAARTLRETLIAKLPTNADDLEKCLVSVMALSEDERARQQSVDGRLTSIVGLSSIAGSVVFGTIIAGALGHDHPGILPRLIISVGGGYLVLQVCSAIAAALRGLGRREYKCLVATDILAGHDEAQAVHRRRQISAYFDVLDQNRTRNNEKVGEMAVAHCAMMNFIWGLFLVAVAGGLTVWLRPPDVDLVEQLKTNQSLREVLRGPRGESGPVGPPGPPCICPVPLSAPASTGKR